VGHSVGEVQRGVRTGDHVRQRRGGLQRVVRVDDVAGLLEVGLEADLLAGEADRGHRAPVDHAVDADLRSPGELLDQDVPFVRRKVGRPLAAGVREGDGLFQAGR
jgi:hypothetical protein